jgi:hypothetical protein
LLPCTEDALAIFEQGAASPEPHAPLFAAYAKLAQRMGRDELAADVRQQLHKLQGRLPWVHQGSPSQDDPA